MATPDPTQVAPWYLRNINQALELNETSGQVFVRTNAQFSGNIGNIVVGNVGINSLGNVDISGNTLPVTGNVNATITNSNLQVTQGTSPWVVSGNVQVSSMPEVEIKNDAGNPISVSKDNNLNSITNPLFVEGVNNGSFFAPTQSDAFGRLRVSNPETFFDTQSRYFDHGQFSTQNNGSATTAYNANSSTFSLNVAAAGDSVIRETTKTFLYQPGKSLLVLNTFCMSSAPSLLQRVGYYGAQNGIYFEVNGSTFNMVIRSSSSGSIVEERIPQSNWNGDPLNGTGPSGIILNPALTQIFWCDIEWLGVGNVRTGFIINGQYIVCHTFEHANKIGNTTTYMTTGSLPIRYEISSTGGTGTLTQICSTVISEGGYSLSGIPRSIAHPLNAPVRLANDPTVFTPLISIRLKSTNKDAIVIPTNYTILPQDQAVVKYRIYIRATTTGGTWTPIGADSSVEYNLSPTTVTSGSVADEGFLVANNQGVSVPQLAGFDFSTQLQRDSLANTQYEYVITAATAGTNIDVWASIGWQEVT